MKLGKARKRGRSRRSPRRVGRTTRRRRQQSRHGDETHGIDGAEEGGRATKDATKEAIK